MTDFLSMYGMEQILDVFETVFGVFGTFTLFGGIFSVVLYVLQGFALLSMSNNCGIKKGWLAFIPIANVFILGKIAEKYVGNKGKKSTKFGILLPVFAALKYIVAAVLTVVLIISLISIIANVELAVELDSQLTLSMFSSFISVIVAYFISLAVTVVYLVFYYIALWRIYSLFNKRNSTLYTVLSVLFDFLSPIFLFVIRDNTPAFDTETNIGYFETEGEI